MDGNYYVNVPLFIKCLQQRIQAYKFDQVGDMKPTTDSYNGGYARACDTILKYLDRVSDDWRSE